VKIWLKRILGILLLPLALTLLAGILLYVPPVGDYVFRRALRQAGQAAKMQISAEHIRLVFPLDLSIKGLQVDSLLRLGELHLRLRPLPLLQKKAEVQELRLSDADLRLTLSPDTAAKDTSSALPSWTIRLDDFALDSLRLSLQMPSDSLSLQAFVKGLRAGKGNFDLAKEAYVLDSLRLSEGELAFDMGKGRPSPHLDPAHLHLNDLSLAFDSLVYAPERMHLLLRDLRLAERCGLRIDSLRGEASADSAAFRIQTLRLNTPHSHLSVEGNLARGLLTGQSTAAFGLRLNASLGSADLACIGDLPESLKTDKAPLSLEAEADGSPDKLRRLQFSARQDSVFAIKLSGEGAHLLKTRLLTAALRVEAESFSAKDFGSFRIPAGLRLEGTGHWAKQGLELNLLLGDGASLLKADGRFSLPDKTYAARLLADSLCPARFLPADSFRLLTADLRLAGRGDDLFADSAVLRLRGRIRHLRYGSTGLDSLQLNANLRGGHLTAGFRSLTPAAKMDFDFSGSLQRHRLDGMMSGNVNHLDLLALHLSSDTLTTSFQSFLELKSDLGENNLLDLTLGNWELNIAGEAIHPKTLVLHAQSGADTTRLSLHAGDLGFTLTGNAGPVALEERLGRFSEEANRQLAKGASLNLNALRPLLPEAKLHFAAAQDNPLYDLLLRKGFDYERFALDASTSPAEGLRLDAGLFNFYKDTLRIDTIRASIRPEADGLSYLAEIIKRPYRRQTAFIASATGCLSYRYADAHFSYLNQEGQVGLDLGFRLADAPEGVEVHFFPDTPVIAFQPFRLNPDNYLRIYGAKDVEADLRFSGEKDASLTLRSQMGADSIYPELHAELAHLSMKALSDGLGGDLDFGGSLGLDLQYAPSAQSFLLAADAHIDSLSYVKSLVGDLTLNAVYLPVGEHQHQVDLHFYQNHVEAASATALYDAQKGGLEGSLSVDSLPLALFNPFVPQKQAALAGRLDAEASLSGTAAQPKIAGFFRLDTASAFVPALDTRFRFDDKKLLLADNRLRMDSFRIFAAGKNPLILDGTIDFRRPSRPRADLHASGKDLQLLDADRRAESIAYGKLLVDADARLRGPLAALNIRGKLDLLGSTNLTYVMQDSPLAAEDRLSGLVSFTSFADTAGRRLRRLRRPALLLGGTDLLLVLHIDPIVRLRADLKPDRSSFVSVEGGGDLSLQYNRQGQMLLNGRYTLSGGRLKYALPVIPLKEFSIKDGSYIQWDGDPMNPLLNLAATQLMRASASLSGEPPRPVDFEVGVDLKKRLKDMGLAFTIAAPEDAAMQAELDRMGADGRSTQAVGMMVTGLYLAGGSGKLNLDMGSALTGFLQNEINNVTGDALKGFDISFGLNTYQQSAEAGGGQRTDYSFRLAKRFYNDRLRLLIGGKVSSGNVKQNESFIDNASLEWRLNKAGTGYLRLFHDKNYQSILDGEVTETGLGFVIRRKMLHFWELFK
jgi:hypothetical protein